MTISLRVRVRQTAPPIVQDEGVDVASRERINFTGAGVTVTDDAANGRVNVEIPGGGIGGGATPVGTDGDVQMKAGSALAAGYDRHETNLVKASKPRVGNGTPFASEGRATITFADANIVLSAAQYSRLVLELTGANTLSRTLTFPLPASADESYFRVLEMGVTGAGVTLTMGSGGTWTIPPASGGSVHIALFTPDGVTVLGAAGTATGALQYRGSTGYTLGDDSVLINTISNEFQVARKFRLGTGGTEPTFTAGTGAPAAAEPNGSIYLRTDGTSTTGVYVREAGAWSALGGGGGSTPTGTGLRKVVAGVEDAAASLLVNADVDAAAAIAGTKVAPDFGAQTIATTGGVTPGFVSFGTPVPAAGQFRSAYGSASWRGHNSVANDSYLVHYEGDGLLIGTGPAYTGTTQAGSVGVYAFGTVGLGIGGSTYIYATNAGVIEMWKPRIGSGTGASPYASDGETPLAGDADATLTASQYSRHAIDISGTTATRTFTFPHPAAQDSSYKKLIINRTANSHTISTGTGTTATVPAGVLKYVWFSPSGADAA